MKALISILLIFVITDLLAQSTSGRIILSFEESRTEQFKRTAFQFENLAEYEQSQDALFVAACYWALAEDHENAFRCLFYLAKNGFSHLQWLDEEQDLSNLKSTLNWWELRRKVAFNQQFFKAEK